MSRTALFSACRRYRYRLGRRWSEGPTVCFVLLNPSTANEVVDDPTIERCMYSPRLMIHHEGGVQARTVRVPRLDSDYLDQEST